MIEDTLKRKLAKESDFYDLLKFDITEGSMYLVKEESSKLSFSLTNFLISFGYKAIVVSKNSENYFNRLLSNNFSLECIGGIGQYVKQSSFYDSIISLIKTAPENTVFFIDGLNNMIMRNDFSYTLNFIYKLREFTYLKSMICLISMNPKVIKNRDYRLIQKESKHVELGSLENLSLVD
jgi:archaellum biogenesis ATPase FlaH